MMGSKERHFALEELVPSDHFYRHLELSLNLSFVRELVQQTYAGQRRPGPCDIIVSAPTNVLLSTKNNEGQPPQAFLRC